MGNVTFRVALLENSIESPKPTPEKEERIWHEKQFIIKHGNCIHEQQHDKDA